MASTDSTSTEKSAATMEWGLAKVGPRRMRTCICRFLTFQPGCSSCKAIARRRSDKSYRVRWYPIDGQVYGRLRETKNRGRFGFRSRVSELSSLKMFELCLNASHGYPPGHGFIRESTMPMAIKDCHPFLASSGVRQDITGSNSLNYKPLRNTDMWNQVIDVTDSTRFVKLSSAIRSPFEAQDEYHGSLKLSFGIAEQYMKHEKIMQFLLKGLREERIDGLDLSSFPELTGSQAFCQEFFTSSLHYPGSEFYDHKPLVDFVGDLARSSKITVQPNGQVSFVGTRVEMKDLLSMVAEFYLSRSSPKWKTQSILVPHYTRLDTNEVGESSVSLHSVSVAPLKNPEKLKPKPLRKKKNTKKLHERDLYKKNYFHACESLLSLMLNKRQNRKTTILSLKKSGPELPELLNQFSVGMAGTGLAVLFSVICKVFCGRAPFCSSKLFNTGFALGLVWLSLAVNRLRDTIVYISKNTGNLELRDEEMMRRVNKSVNGIYFRAAVLMAVAALRIG